MISYDEYCSKYTYQTTIDEYYEKALKFLKGSKMYGFNIDTSSAKEMIAVLYFAYQNKDYTVKDLHKVIEMREYGA